MRIIEPIINMQKMARKRGIYRGFFREGRRPPEGMVRGDIFEDSRGNMWGVVGRGKNKRVVQAWKVPHYTPGKNKPVSIPHSESFSYSPRKRFVVQRKGVWFVVRDRGTKYKPIKLSGPHASSEQATNMLRRLEALSGAKTGRLAREGQMYTITDRGKLAESGQPYTRVLGPKHKRKVKQTRADRVIRHEAEAIRTPKNKSRKWPQALKDKKKWLREKTANYNKWKRSLPVRLRRPAAAVRALGLGSLAAYGAYRGLKAIRRHQRRLEKAGRYGDRPMRGSKPIRFVAPSKPNWVAMRHLGDTNYLRVAMRGHRLVAQNIINGELVRIPVDNDDAKLWWNKRISWSRISHPIVKNGGFINNSGFYETYDKLGNLICLMPEDGRAIEKGDKTLEEASANTLCSLIGQGIANQVLEHEEEAML